MRNERYDIDDYDVMMTIMVGDHHDLHNVREGGDRQNSIFK